MNFDSGSLAATWRKWKQTMQFYLNAVMSGKAEEEQSSIFLFVIDERGREIFNTFAWNKKIRDGVETEEDDIYDESNFKSLETTVYQRKM